LAIAEGLVAARPGDQNAQRGLYVGLLNLAMFCERTQGLHVARAYWARACTVMRDSDARGWLPEGERQYLDMACRKARAG
jgi:hypothetical protein